MHKNMKKYCGQYELKLDKTNDIIQEETKNRQVKRKGEILCRIIQVKLDYSTIYRLDQEM